MNCWLNARLNASAHGRAMMSLAPPGAYGTINLTGRFGQFDGCAAALRAPMIDAAPSVRNSRRRTLTSRLLSACSTELDASLLLKCHFTLEPDARRQHDQQQHRRQNQERQ